MGLYDKILLLERKLADTLQAFSGLKSEHEKLMSEHEKLMSENKKLQAENDELKARLWSSVYR